MKRTYINQLPKGENGTVKNAKIENGQLIVEVEFEKKFEPKDGDFLITERGIVFIFNPHYESPCVPFYIGTNFFGELIVHKENEISGYGQIEDCRYATEQEKANFLLLLETKFRKRWNAEKKCLEDIRWRAEKKGLYYFLVFREITYVHSCIDIRISRDNIRYDTGNYFKTREAAQKVADEIQKIFKNSEAL